MSEIIIEILQKACALEEDISFESELSLLSLDSLSFVNVIVELEEAFGIEFELDELNIFAWDTVGDIIKCMEEKINAKK